MTGINANALVFSVLYLGLVIAVLVLAFYFSLKANHSGVSEEATRPQLQEICNETHPEPEYAEVTPLGRANQATQNEPQSVTYAVVDKSKKSSIKKSKNVNFPVPVTELTEYATVQH